ncbi:MAG: hypothetical protein Q8L02_02880 [Candidatus Nitrotoga sp.]|nr:hypothetical protein [Candidatus Nitrotoga sp.]
MEIVIKIIQNPADYSACCSKCRGAAPSVGQYLARRDSHTEEYDQAGLRQSPAAVHAWLNDPFPAIAECSKIDPAAFHIIF